MVLIGSNIGQMSVLTLFLVIR